jgi:hypothetical protein
MLNWAVSRLPWGSDERDKTRLSGECKEILADLPPEVSEAEAKEALEPTVTETRREIEQRQAAKERQTRKPGLIQHGIAEASSYLLQLKQKGEISDEEYLDSEFTAGLKQVVRGGLETRLSGDEATNQLRELVREIINGELD